MTDFNTSAQFGGMYGGFDVPCKNTSGADIPSGSVVFLDTTNVISAAQPVAGITLAAGPGGYGITTSDTPAGGYGSVRRQGAAVAVAGGSITAGARVTASASTNGQVVAATSGQAQIGYARNTVVAGDAVIVDFAFANNA